MYLPVLASLACQDILARCQHLSFLSHSPSSIMIFQLSLQSGALTSDWDGKWNWNTVDKFFLQRALFLQATYLFGTFCLEVLRGEEEEMNRRR